MSDAKHEARDDAPGDEAVPSAGFLVRLSAALPGAALAGLLAAFADAAYASGGVPSLRLFTAELGLVAPLSLVLGAFASVAAFALLPPEWPRLGARFERLARRPAQVRRELSLRIAFVTLAALLGLVLVTRVALRLLANTDPAPGSGAVLALATVLVAALVVAIGFGGAALASRAGARSLPGPLATGVVSLLAAALAFGLAIGTGATSGAGGPLDVFGVFRRQELDLRAPGLLLCLLLGALIVPPVRRRALALGLVLSAFLPLSAVPYAAGSGFDRQTALAVERRAPLGKLLLGQARKLADRDRDGASALFGGGDCAEGNPGVGPDVEDVPGNGVDEDCSGADAARIVPQAPAAPRPVEASDFIRKHVPAQPNVILITIDATRAELGYMGYPRKISPNLDAFAQRSAIFENAYSLASYTSKSLGPMLIGRYGSETHRGFLHFNRFTKDDLFLSERLQRAGIRTLSVQGHWYFFKNYGFERGYDVIDTQATPADQPIEGDKSSNGDLLSDRIIAALERPELEQQRFFLWSHYIDPHAEYVPHEGFDFGHRGRERYDGEIAFVDHHLGRVFAALEKRPFASRTVVIITSDHGEAFGEHALYRHGFELWEELVRVPLIVHVPGAAPVRIPARRSAIDVTPTVLDIFGITPPEAGAKDALRGESLLPDVLAPPGHTPRGRVVYIDMPAGPYNDERQAYIEDDKKLITSGGRPLGLFDLASDPGEKRDLADDPKIARPLLEKTRAFRRALDEVVERPK
ncbi:MAG TPA: sulfatase [Polyangiaceae bacterium]